MLPSGFPFGQSGGMDNPYVCVFNHGSPVCAPVNKDKSVLVTRPCLRTARQAARLHRAWLHASQESTKQWEDLNQGATNFLVSASPTVGNLVNHTQTGHRSISRPLPMAPITVNIAHANLAARESVRREYAKVGSSAPYGSVSILKPDNVIRILYENFSSLSLFAGGPGHHKKIRQLNKLMTKYGWCRHPCRMRDSYRLAFCT